MTDRRARIAAPVAALLLALGCATTAPPRLCGTTAFGIDVAFEGAAVATCEITPAGVAILTIRPEDPPPINVSPWFAFRLAGNPGPIRVRLEFEDGYARYWPKLSDDGKNWRPLSKRQVARSEDGTTMDLTIPGGRGVRWIAAQELLTGDDYDRWIAEFRAHSEVTVAVAGHSVQGRPIQVARTGAHPDSVVLLGRQHPPEVSGAIAMRHFVSAVLADTDLARRFRDRFSVIIAPLINPDGVARGHWRHNVNGVDLNRDWGPFSQPETQSIAGLLAELEGRGSTIRLMLDFHSTRSNLFYTQVPEDGARPLDFAREWLTRSRVRLPDYEFSHEARPPSGQANTKNYFFDRYGIAAITYEVGDETERSLIAGSAPVFAEEMMRLMLEHHP